VEIIYLNFLKVVVNCNKNGSIGVPHIGCISHSFLVNIITILRSKQKRQTHIYQGLGFWSFFIVYTPFYTSLIYQRFCLLQKPGSCIKKWGFMQSLYFLKYFQDLSVYGSVFACVYVCTFGSIYISHSAAVPFNHRHIFLLYSFNQVS
jgi:hypothetical protein